jgi:DNA helicase-2/ATP-dependent DNA helicase PcrA
VAAVRNGSTAGVSSTSDGLQEGALIEHQRFGVGRVLKVEGVGENRKATVEFRNTGTKQLLLKFARYKVIG